MQPEGLAVEKAMNKNIPAPLVGMAAGVATSVVLISITVLLGGTGCWVALFRLAALLIGFITFGFVMVTVDDIYETNARREKLEAQERQREATERESDGMERELLWQLVNVTNS
jgi:fatty acid desaturase